MKKTQKTLALLALVSTTLSADAEGGAKQRLQDLDSTRKTELIGEIPVKGLRLYNNNNLPIGTTSTKCRKMCAAVMTKSANKNEAKGKIKWKHVKGGEREESIGSYSVNGRRTTIRQSYCTCEYSGSRSDPTLGKRFEMYYDDNLRDWHAIYKKFCEAGRKKKGWEVIKINKDGGCNEQNQVCLRGAPRWCGFYHDMGGT